MIIRNAIGRAKNKTVAPRIIHVFLQPTIGIIKAMNGTKIKPPMEPPDAIKAIAVARLRWNHLETRAAAVFIVPALPPTAINTPKTIIR